jgi:hypothetical protein
MATCKSGSQNLLPKAWLDGTLMKQPADHECCTLGGPLQGAAESLPAPDASYDVVYCVYLLHELPPAIRRKAMFEMARWALHTWPLCTHI